MMTMVVIDTSVVVALADEKDKWHARAVLLRDVLLATGIELLYFDCVVNEAIGVIGRRAEEQQRSDQFGRLLDKLLSLVPNEAITWISVDSERLFPEILAVCRGHQGRLDFHDAFIALVCRELGIKAIVSFDRDFDSITWLKRVDTPVGVSNLLAET